VSAPTIDFQHAGRTPGLGWVILAIGAMGLSTALWIDHTWSQERAAQAAALQAQAEARRQRAAQVLQRTPNSAADERRLQFAARQLAQPWLPALRLIENATEPPVFVLGLSMDPAAGSLRLDGEAPSLQQALGYAKALQEKNLLGPAELRSHETSTDPAGHAVVRFTLLAPLSAKP
jgi:hypothetical protein